MKKLFLAVLATIAGMALTAFYVRHEWRKPYPALSVQNLVEIPRGLRAREVVALLQDKNVIKNQYTALAYLLFTRLHTKLQAGEYMFDRPMTVPEVINKLASGDVFLRKFTIPEGLTIEETARKWEEQGFGKAEEFQAAAADSVELVRQLDEKAVSVEGYLFPETYSSPSRTTSRQAIEAMVKRFRAVAAKLQEAAPQGQWPLNLRDTVILASLVETEAANGDERPLVASVYLNRLNQNILLQCDPTVVYALEQAGRYQGSLTLDDLRFQSPYNTYVNAGLPPGPIANPGYAALLASIQPAATKHLFFVRTADGRHTFSETLAAHNRAVAAYRRMQQEQRRDAGGRS
jgi:UPF0755 protein